MNESVRALATGLLEAYKTEAKLGRHPHLTVEKAGGLNTVQVASDQISERLELRPDHFATFKDLCKQNGVVIEG